MSDLTSLSKFLARILRHQADNYGIMLNDDGFANIDDVWTLITEHYGSQYTKQDLHDVIDGDQYGKKRYELVDNKIRALFGHSTGITPINYPGVIPPDILYHGTNKEAIDSIKESGLQTINRQYVHLTTNLDNATRVAQRHALDIVILTVHALDAHAAQIIFHQPEPEHFLCKHVPPEFIDFGIHLNVG